MIKKHSFHIPVMGLAFTIDSPLKVAAYGMDSVVSIGDDILMEKLRKMYCEKLKIPYQEITEKIDDFRAKRITSYLNLLKDQAEKKFENIVNATVETKDELKKHLRMLPDRKSIFEEIKKITADSFEATKTQAWLKRNLTLGSIDVNIMTKLDKANYIEGKQQPVEFNDAHSALRGFANSDLDSSIVFSAGMNPRLFSYIEKFDDFYSNGTDTPKKRIVLKVSDYRSAYIQGKIFAKKGLWVSEFRIESGLNCGGHAFATDGYLIGPILKEFKDKKDELIQEFHEIMVGGLEAKERAIPSEPLELKITAQGGVGTNEEHDFLLNEYNLDSIGWGTPFLLVPEATTVDPATIQKLKKAKEKDLYMSNVSPLGVPFNNLRGNTKDDERSEWIDKGRPGSSCPKKFLSLNTEFTEKPICTASRQYQHLKLKQLKEEMGEELSPEEYNKQEFIIEDKSCICVGLGTSALLVNGIDTKVEGQGVSICPGPGMAYFDKELTLSEMTDHIYGRMDNRDIVRQDRPHVFIKELDLYLKYLTDKIEETKLPISPRERKKYFKFIGNLMNGVRYYTDLFSSLASGLKETNEKVLAELTARRTTIVQLERLVTSMD